LPTNVIILLILLGIAAAAIVLTLVFVAVVDRRLARERSGPETEGEGETRKRGPQDEGHPGVRGEHTE
jgi:hypothetical protein